MRQDYARPVGQASGTELAWSGQAFDSYSSSDEMRAAIKPFPG